MPVPGEVWHVAIQHRQLNTLPEQCALSTWYLQVTSGAGTVHDLSECIRGSYQPIVNLMGIGTEGEGVYLRRVQPTSTPEVAVAWSPHVISSSPIFAFPTAESVLVLRQTGIRGRQNWGRCYVPWTTEAIRDPTTVNNLSNVGVGVVQSAFNSFAGSLIAGSAGPLNLQPVVYSYRSSGGGTHWASITTYTPMVPYRTQGKRGRRTGPCPPFEETAVTMLYGGVAYDLYKEGFARSYTDHHNHVKGLRLTLGNGMGNAAEPTDWQLPGFDDSAWSDVLNVVSPHGVGVPDTGPTSPCVTGDNPVFGMTMPSWYSTTDPDVSHWNALSAPLTSPWYVWPPGGPDDYQLIEADGIVLIRNRLRTDWGDGVILTAQLEFNAVDSIGIWIDGTTVVDDPDTSVVYPDFPSPRIFEVGDLLGPGDHILAIRLRSNNASPGGNIGRCSSVPGYYSHRQKHAYSDCNPWNRSPVCHINHIIGNFFDLFVDWWAYVALRIKAESIPPP